MDKGRGAASWEQVHRSLFPGGPVPSSLLNAKNGGAGILGPAPVPRDGFPLPPMAPPVFGIEKQQQQQGPPPPPPPMPPGFGPSGPPMNSLPAAGLMAPPPPGTVSRLGSPPFAQANDNAKPLPPPPPASQFLPPPPRPRSLEMVQNIERMAAFVARYGEESVAKEKHYGNPNVPFLYGGEPGSDAALGLQYYEWKKAALTRLLQARKAVVEGKLPPDRLKAMERELEQYTLVQQMEDARSEMPMPPPESGHRAWNQMPPDMDARHPAAEGQHFPRREAPEPPPEQKHRKPDDVFSNGSVNQSNDSRKDNNKRPRAARDPRRERNNDVDRTLNDENNRRRRNRSRSPDRSRQHRSPRRRHRSHSRSPRRKEPAPMLQQQQEMNLSPRRNKDRHQQQQPELEERREDYLNNNSNHLRMPLASPQPQVLPPPPPGPPPGLQMQQQSQQRPQSPQQPPPGFLSPAENAYSRFISMVDPSLGHKAPSQVSSGPPGFPSKQAHDSGLLRSGTGAGASAAPPASLATPVVGAFSPKLSEIPPHQQQILLQQLQLAAAAAAAAAAASHAAPSAASTPNSGLSPLLMASPAAAAALVGALGGQVPVQVSLPQQQQQQQPAAAPAPAGTAKISPESPSNDVEMEVVEASPSPQKEVSSKQGEENGSGAKPDDESEEASDRAHKGKTDKDGRALKVVRNAVAEFVKELLNPKWREGILSKDDFKLIAKKAVDKVVGNLQGSQIPKGAERVEKFMSSSKEKITKLVQEYVEKHAKHNTAAASATEGNAVKSEAA